MRVGDKVNAKTRNFVPPASYLLGEETREQLDRIRVAVKLLGSFGDFGVIVPLVKRLEGREIEEVAELVERARVPVVTSRRNSEDVDDPHHGGTS